jgi:PmbA protein
MEPQEVLERALKVAQEAEVFHLHRRDEPVVFEANRLKRIEGRESSGMALRIVKDGRIGFSSTTNERDIESLVDSAVEMAPFGPKAWLTFPGPQQYEEVPVHDPEVESLPLDDMVQLGQGMIDQVRRHTPDLLCQATVARDVTTLSVYNSRGTEARYTKAVFSASIEGELIQDTDMLFVWEGESACHPITDASTIVGSVIQQLERSRQVVPAPTGEMPILFTPHGIAEALLPPLLAGLNGRAVRKGASPFIPGSRICDDEGVPSRRLSLIEGGTISSFLYDLQTAAQAGAASTGSAHRRLGSMPGPAASVLVLKEGTETEEGMLGGIGRGLVVEHLLGAGQSNVQGGEFSANLLLGYLVEKGKIEGRVKNTLIAGNVYNVLRRIRGVGRESRWVGGSVKTPPLLCEGVSVATES